MTSTSLPALRDRTVGVKRGQNPNIGVEAAVSKHWGEKRTNPKHWGFPDYYPFNFFPSADTWRPGGFRPRHPPLWTPRRCTVESDFAMSAAGVDLTNFLKGWGRSGGF